MAKANASEFLRLVGLPEGTPLKWSEYYLCSCLICGTQKMVAAKHLVSNSVKSCGCLTKLGPPKDDLTGREVKGSVVFGYLGSSIWRCYHPSCGHWSEANQETLKNGREDQSYCPKCSISKMLVARNTTHSMSGKKSRAYNSWLNMRRRCGEESNNRYYRYGGRGVSVCKEWEDSFETFLKDLGECPEGKTLDRRDNNKGYCKGNCRWVDMYEQAKSKSNNYLIRIEGEDKTLRAWCKHFGLNYKAIFHKFKYVGEPLNTLFGVESVDFVHKPE